MIQVWRRNGRVFWGKNRNVALKLKLCPGQDQLRSLTEVSDKSRTRPVPFKDTKLCTVCCYGNIKYSHSSPYQKNEFLYLHKVPVDRIAQRIPDVAGLALPEWACERWASLCNLRMSYIHFWPGSTELITVRFVLATRRSLAHQG